MIRDVGFVGDRTEVPIAAAGRFASKAIPDGESVDVYGLNLDAHSEAIEAFEAVLSPHERAEVARLDRRQQRRRVAISRGALRRILAGYFERPPAEVPLAREPLGKPYVDLAAFGGRKKLHVSCSRSGPYAIFAVATGQPIGVDIEVANAENFSDQVAEIVLSPEESKHYATLPSNARTAWLARAWVAKEAILKGLGCGLEIHPGSINVAAPFADDAVADAFAWTSRATAFPPWWLCESAWGPSVVAFATRRRPSSLRFAELTPDH
ncbi:MAG: 4'-phosphopantetheinyl transferase superfamily protein [Betaproteobacteria bacterium]|nr:4'-phosphopantetheinyl transferase superfamily protein [Gammaproteobacteria bacterium]MDH3436826.1 4'-phosphopantetheinyl transferase superfamily protein [Betaproteobacteria bacterium]